MRTDQLLHLQVRDIVFKDTYMQLNIRRLKTDQMQNGALVHIAKLESPLCPYTFTKTYIAEMGLHDGDFLIFQFKSTKKGHNVKGHQPLSYFSARQTFIHHMKRIFPDKNIGLHGLRGRRCHDV